MGFRKLPISLRVLALLLSCAFIGLSQDETIRIEANLVQVPVTVLDRDGRHVTNLKKDTVLAQQGCPQTGRGAGQTRGGGDPKKEGK